MALFSKGIMLTQHKEPALSRRMVQYINSQPTRFNVDFILPEDPLDLTADQIISIAGSAHIYDEDDGRLIATKMRNQKGKSPSVVIDAVDDEPYVSSKLNPMLQLSELALLGVRLLKKVSDAENVVINTYRHIGDKAVNIPSKLGEFKIEKLKGGYPVLPSTVTQRRGYGLLTVGIGAVIHLARAVLFAIPQTSTFVTVAGNTVVNPMNLEMSIGMTISDALDRCGLSQIPDKVIIGGSMTGISILDTDATMITPTTRAILAFHGKKHEKAYSCIGCGRCEQFCPTGLNPKYIHEIIETKSYSQLDVFDAHYCIGCGSCSYICPSRIYLAESTKRAREIAKERIEKAKKQPKKKLKEDAKEEKIKEETKEIKEEIKEEKTVSTNEKSETAGVEAFYLDNKKNKEHENLSNFISENTIKSKNNEEKINQKGARK